MHLTLTSVFPTLSLLVCHMTSTLYPDTILSRRDSDRVIWETRQVLDRYLDPFAEDDNEEPLENDYEALADDVVKEMYKELTEWGLSTHTIRAIVPLDLKGTAVIVSVRPQEH